MGSVLNKVIHFFKQMVAPDGQLQDVDKKVKDTSFHQEKTVASLPILVVPELPGQIFQRPEEIIVKLDHTVLTVKRLLSPLLREAEENISLFFKGQRLNEEDTIMQLEIQFGDRIIYRNERLEY